MDFLVLSNYNFFILAFFDECTKTRMTTFTKTKFKKSDDQMNIDKYRVAANITYNDSV